MNGLHVTVTIPLLLVLAGFNNAHGLTTFGKSQSNNSPQQPPPVQSKSCTSHSDCRPIANTSCVPEPLDRTHKSCLCGDNKAPVNGACFAKEKGPKHLCSATMKCVKGAECVTANRKSNLGNEQEQSEKICKCMEGYYEVGSLCGGASSVEMLSIPMMLAVTLIKTLY